MFLLPFLSQEDPQSEPGLRYSRLRPHTKPIKQLRKKILPSVELHRPGDQMPVEERGPPGNYLLYTFY